VPRFYVTTPIYYVNDIPHVGHAYTTVIADALRRFHQVVGDETYFLTGTDEHGQKIERKAAEEKTGPQAYVDRISTRFKDAWPKLDVVYDRFIRTTDADHEAFVAELWKTIQAKGDLYLGDYEAFYCVGCESFKTDKELEEGNICPLHKQPVEKVKEQTYFFALKKYQSRLLEFYERRPGFIQPETRRNEVLSFVKAGLEDLSCSRTTFTWGIAVPGDPKHVMYVWFDALANYRSALGHGDLAKKFWAPNAEVVHLVGKDILRFHAVYWPAFLMAAGYSDDELPSAVFAHGFLTIDGDKMSKALKNGVDPLKVAAELGPDVLRYHLLRAVAFGQDGDFDHAALLERYNADLGKNVGNLLSRVLGLCARMTEGKHPADEGEDGPLEKELREAYGAAMSAAHGSWKTLAPHVALEQTMKLSSAANAYVDRTAPWAEAKAGNTARVAKSLSYLLRVLEALSVMLWPAMPKKSDAMRAQLGLPPLEPKPGASAWPADLPAARPGHALASSGPLFPTFDDKARKELLERLVPKAPDAGTAAAAGATSKGSTSERSERGVLKTDGGVIGYDDFAKLDLRVGLVKTCEKVPKKDKLLKLTVDLGEPEPRTIVAGLALTFTPETLVGRRVVVVANLAPRDFGGSGGRLVSHGMLLATGPSEALHLATIDDGVPPGSRLK
jgi:methionyl-tRNA synthetase